MEGGNKELNQKPKLTIYNKVFLKVLLCVCPLPCGICDGPSYEGQGQKRHGHLEALMLLAIFQKNFTSRCFGDPSSLVSTKGTILHFFHH